MIQKFVMAAICALVSTASLAQFADAHPVKWDGPSPSSYPVHGIDVARYQNFPNWQQLRQSGVQFAFIKATEGSDRLDTSFQHNWNGAKQAGVARGAYHFYYFCSSPEAQAAWFIQNVPKEAGSLPPVIDLEFNPQSPTCAGKPAPATARAVAKTFMDILQNHYGQRPIIYVNVSFYRENELWRMGGEEFWLRSTATVPSTTYPNQAWSFWQYSATGLIDGVEGKVDVNVFGGTESDWSNWFARRSVK